MIRLQLMARCTCLVLPAALILAACTTAPIGPSVAVMPGSGKSFEQFNEDDIVCRQYASNQNNGSAQAGNDKAIESGVVGTLVGAVAGAAIGGRNGAAVGAGAGLLIGSAAGANASQSAQYSGQRRYDISYEQCMYSKGNSVPVSGQLHHDNHPAPYAPPPPNMPPPRQ